MRPHWLLSGSKGDVFEFFAPVPVSQLRRYLGLSGICAGKAVSDYLVSLCRLLVTLCLNNAQVFTMPASSVQAEFLRARLGGRDVG